MVVEGEYQKVEDYRKEGEQALVAGVVVMAVEVEIEQSRDILTWMDVLTAVQAEAEAEEAEEAEEMVVSCDYVKQNILGGIEVAAEEEVEEAEAEEVVVSYDYAK